ncbi:hypothetical protein RLOC_00012366 [Lonchura striata]|uniref:Uncharacterized protein n=1 Tax=Lonchura striata TaxID=40157 RepID=A0A218USJ9_9PASE|nr:hypothetical protein RLOC_00012366 [Lonchura striata domestica]
MESTRWLHFEKQHGRLCSDCFGALPSLLLCGVSGEEEALTWAQGATLKVQRKWQEHGTSSDTCSATTKA